MFTKYIIRTLCYKTYNNQSNDSISDILLRSLKAFPLGFIFIICIGTFFFFAILGDLLEIIGCLFLFFIFGLPSILLIRFIFIFMPSIICNPKTNIFKSVGKSRPLVNDNIGVVISTLLIRDSISILLLCTRIGIIICILFSIITTTTLYKKLD